MKLIERYIFRRIVQMFLAALLPVLSIIWTIQVLQRINLVTDTGQSMGSFMSLATLLLPTLIPVVLPFALVIGITQTFTAMNNDSELAVLDAAGAPRRIMFMPVAIIAVTLSLVSFAITNFAEPPARSAARQMVAAAYADLLSSVIEEKTFRQLQDGLYVQIERRNGRVLYGLLVADRRDPAFDLMYYAKEGSIDPGGTSMTMLDGEVHQKTPDGQLSIVKFASYAFDLSSMSKAAEDAPPEETRSASDSNLAFLLNPDPEAKNYKEAPGQFHSELHRRLSDWLYVLSFAIISLVAAADVRSHRQARLHPMVAALAFAFFLRWLGFYVTNQAKQNELFVPLVYAVPVVSGLIATGLLMSTRKIRISDTMTRISRIIRNRLSRGGSTGNTPGPGAPA